MANVAVVTGVSLVAGFIGGVFGTRVMMPSDDYIASVVQTKDLRHLTLGNYSGEHMSLDAQGLRIQWGDGREVSLHGSGLDMTCGKHHVTLGAYNKDPLDAAYLVLDGRVWHAPSQVSTIKVLAGLSAMGDIDLSDIEDNQPR